MPKLKGVRFTTAIIERYRWRAASVEEAMIETSLSGVSTQAASRTSPRSSGAPASPRRPSPTSTRRRSPSVEEWRNRPLDRAYPYVYVDGVHLKRSWGCLRERRRDGGDRRERRRIPRGHRCRRGLHRVVRVLAGVPLVAEVRAACSGCENDSPGTRRPAWSGSIAEVFPERRLPEVHGRTSTAARLAKVPKSKKRAEVGRHARGDPCHGVARGLPRPRRSRRPTKLDAMRLKEAAKVVRDGYAGDPGLHGVPARALAAHTHQQRHRAAEPRDPQARARGGDVPRRELRPSCS